MSRFLYGNVYNVNYARFVKPKLLQTVKIKLVGCCQHCAGTQYDRFSQPNLGATLIRFANSLKIQDSLKLLKAAYRLANELPNKERYNLSDQMRRASCSILLKRDLPLRRKPPLASSLNIAEGYGRYHYLERLRFLYIARGSLAEILSAFVIAKSLGYCTTEQLDQVRSLKKNLNGYCRFISLNNKVKTNMETNTSKVKYYPQSPIPSPQSHNTSLNLLLSA